MDWERQRSGGGRAEGADGQGRAGDRLTEAGGAWSGRRKRQQAGQRSRKMELERWTEAEALRCIDPAPGGVGDRLPLCRPGPSHSAAAPGGSAFLAAKWGC